jgi:hypothetical protein
MKLLTLFAGLFFALQLHAQTVTLPIDFEGGTVVNGDFTNFDGGTATVIANPQSGGPNTSATVGQMVRNGGQVWAGAYLTTPANVDFSTNPIICMQVWTTAPIGTRIALKMEGCGGGCFRELDAFTTVTGTWETLCYDFTGEPTVYNRLVFLFDLGNLGNGSAASTFLFDDVEQLPILPLFYTAGSQYFCPNQVLTMAYSGSGSYNWYDEATGGNLVATGSASYVTSLLTGDSSWYVQDMTPTVVAAAPVGPTSRGASNPQAGTASVFFTSNLDNGFWYSVDIVEKIVGGGPPPYTCQYTVTGHNLTQGTNRTLTWNHVGATDNAQYTYAFPTALPMDLLDNMELRVTVSGDVGCFISSHHSGGDVITTFPTSSAGGELEFTGHTPVANNWMGFDYNVSGDFIDPTRFRVNAIADCAVVLPIELLEFYVTEVDGNALLTWTTATETDNEYFKIESSTDALNFETIATQPGAGTSSNVNRYSFTDTNPKDGLSYYRITQVDFNGESSSSWVVAFTMDDLQNFSVFPNPTTGSFTLTKNLSFQQNMEIEIRDITGKIVAIETIIDAEGTFAKTFDIEHYPAGIYSVLIQTPSKTQLVKVIKH